MKDLRHTSLSVQAAQLKRTLESRDKRRQADKHARTLEKEHEEGGSGSGARAGLQAPNQQVAALAALTDMHDASAVAMFHCDLCQATFTTEVQHTQHLQSAVHRKAVEKKQKEEERVRRMQAAGLHDVTTMALGAGAWSATHDKGSRAPGGGGGGGGGSYAAGRQQQGRRPPQHATAAAPSRDIISHQELTAALRAEEEPLSIDGWVPPSITAPVVAPPTAQQQPAPPDEDSSEQADDQQPVQVPDPAAAAADDDDDEDSSDESSKSSGKAGRGLLGLGYGGSSSGDDSGSDSDDSQDQPPPTSFF